MISPTCTRIATPQGSKFQRLMHTRDVRGYNYTRRNYSSFGHRLYVNFAVRRDYSSPAARALRRPRRARDYSLPAAWVYVNLVVRRDYSSPAACSTSTLSCTASTRFHSPGCSDLHRVLRLAQARRRLLHLRRACGCLSTSCGSSHGSSRRSSSTTPPRAGSSSTTSPPPCDWVPRHVTRLVAPLVVDYSGLVVDYFANAARPGASVRRAARHGVRRRLLRAPQLPLCGHTGSTSATLCVATTCLAATLALLRVRRTPLRRRLPVASRRPFISTSFPN
jgi:hypothetical protein